MHIIVVDPLKLQSMLDFNRNEFVIKKAFEIMQSIELAKFWDISSSI